jgi:hypothetical protein
MRQGLGDVAMRPSWWAFVLLGALTGSVTYQLTNQSSLPNPLPGVSDESKPQPLDRKSYGPLIAKDEARLQEGDSSPGVLKPDQLPDESKPQPLDQKSDGPLIAKDEARLHESDSAPAVLKPDQLPVAQDHASLEDAAGTGVIDLSNSNYVKQNLSYLAYYAYSELPPETKPADTVLNSLKGIPPGTPVDEIKRIADLLGLDFTFMKTVAKIESNFNPTQRTGSYIGLFQLSNYEFGKYGSGDLRDSRDNTVAAALKFMTEAILFEMFTHKKPTLNDLYLIHQQGVEGAAEHVSHPNRLAWRSMCATDEGKEKGEKWCKRAIWGNTLPAIKRVWKTVNNVTSDAFVGMWQQRVSHFYAKYSDAAAN